MKVVGIIPESMIDYAGKVGPVIFAGGCNYSCPTCYNNHLNWKEEISDDFDKFLKNTARKAKAGWYNGITICGGEPTIHGDLPEFLAKIKKATGLPVKLDTNGSNPRMLERLAEENLVDYLAMDVKGPKSLYPRLTGLEPDVEKVEASIKIASRFPDYEFRTTVVPFDITPARCWTISFPENRIFSWIPAKRTNLIELVNRYATIENIEKYEKDFEMMHAEKIFIDGIAEMAEWIQEVTDGRSHKHYLQGFTTKKESENAILDKKFAKENLPENMRETPLDIMEEMQEAGRESGYDFLIR